MIALILAVLSSSLVAIIMRVSGGRVKHNLGMLAMSYIVSTVLSGFFGGFSGVFDLSVPGGTTALVLGAVNGVLYLAGFVLIQMNVQKNGVVLSSVFQKLGLLVTLVVSVVFYHEIPDILQGTGFIIAIFAIVLMNYQKGQNNVGSRWALIAMLLSCGMADAMSKIFTESGAAALEEQFLVYTFGMAMVLSVAMTFGKGQRIGLQELAFGTLIAFPNFFASKFLLGALEALSAVIVYPAFCVGSILVVTMAGVLAFRERLSRRQWIAIGAILVALVLLNI